ncbi:MAG: hypothetical protein HZA25_01525 [Candidatus Niyogibacteria bacterium]|nr:hypothetical protein [Candidatus Niyogibacteria bacterium]
MDVLSPKTIARRCKPLQERQSAIAEEYKKLAAEKEALHGRLGIVCPHCKKRAGIAAFTFIQEHWYTAPYSCTGGDFWNQSKPEVCSLICPHCAGELYIYNLPEREDIVAVVEKVSPKSFFKEYKERYKK